MNILQEKPKQEYNSKYTTTPNKGTLDQPLYRKPNKTRNIKSTFVHNSKPNKGTLNQPPYTIPNCPEPRISSA